MRKCKKRQTVRKRKRKIGKNIIPEQGALDYQEKPVLSLRKTKTQISLKMPENSLKYLTDFFNDPSDSTNETYLSEVPETEHDRGSSAGVTLPNTVFVSLEIIEEENRSRNQKCKSLSSHIRKIASCHKKYMDKKVKPQKPRSSVSFSKAFGSKRSQLIKSFRKIPKQYKQIISIAKLNLPLDRHTDIKLTRVRELKRKSRGESYEERSSGDCKNVEKFEQPKRINNSVKFFQELPKNYTDLWPTFTLQMPESDVSKVDKKFIKSIIQLANDSGKLDKKFLFQLDNQKFLSNSLAFDKKDIKLDEEKAEIDKSSEKQKGESIENLSDSSHTLIKVKITEKENKLKESIKTTVDITSSVEKAVKKNDEDENHKRLSSIKKLGKISELIKSESGNTERKESASNKLKASSNTTELTKIDKKQKLKGRESKSSKLKQSKIKELWRREAKQSSSDFSVSSQSSQTNVDYTYLGMKSYRALKQIVEKEVERISKNYLSEEQQKNNDGENKLFLINGKPKKVKLSDEKKMQKKIAKKKMLQTNANNAAPADFLKNFKLNFEETPASPHKEENKRNITDHLQFQEISNMNLEIHSNSKIANEIIKNWSILHRLEKAFLAVGTPKLSNQNFTDVRSQRKKELSLWQSNRVVSQSSIKKKQALGDLKSKQKLNAEEQKLNPVKPKKSQLSSCSESDGRKKERLKNQKYPLSDEKALKKTTPLGLFEESLTKKNRADLRSISLRDRPNCRRKEYDSESYNSVTSSGTTRTHTSLESKSAFREKKPLTRQTKSPRTNFQYNINTIQKKSKSILKRRDYLLDLSDTKGEGRAPKAKVGGEIVRAEKDLYDKSCKGDEKIETHDTKNKIAKEEKFDNASMKDFKKFTESKCNSNSSNQKERKLNVVENREPRTENKANINLRITARHPNQKLVSWMNKTEVNNFLLKDSQKKESRKEANSICNLKKNYDFLKQTDSDSGMDDGTKHLQERTQNSKIDHSADNSNKTNSSRSQKPERPVKERSILSLAQHFGESPMSKSFASEHWKAKDSPPERNLKYQKFLEANEENKIHTMHRSSGSAASTSTSHPEDSTEADFAAENLSKTIQKNNAHSLGNLKGTGLKACQDDEKLSGYKKEGRQWENDINTYREIVKEIIGQYDRINGLLKQNKEVTQDYEYDSSNEKTKDERQNFWEYPNNLKEYRKKIMSEYSALPIFEYKSKIEEDEARKNGNAEFSMPRNLLVVKDLRTEIDLDVKDLPPHIHHVLDSHLYVDKKDVLRRRMNGRGMEKLSSLPEAALRPEKLTDSEEVKKNNDQPKTHPRPPPKAPSSYQETTDSQLLSTISTTQDELYSDSFMSSSDFDQNTSDPSFPESTIFYLTSLSECFI